MPEQYRQAGKKASKEVRKAWEDFIEDEMSNLRLEWYVSALQVSRKI